MRGEGIAATAAGGVSTADCWCLLARTAHTAMVHYSLRIRIRYGILRIRIIRCAKLEGPLSAVQLDINASAFVTRKKCLGVLGSFFNRLRHVLQYANCFEIFTPKVCVYIGVGYFCVSMRETASC